MNVSRKKWSAIEDLINERAGFELIRIDTQYDNIYKFDEGANAFLFDCSLAQTSKQELFNEYK